MPNRPPLSSRVAALAGLLLLPGLGAAQVNGPIPLGEELDLSGDDAPAVSPAVAHDGSGRFLVAWLAHGAGGDAIQARIVRRTATGSEALPPFTVHAGEIGVGLSAPGVAMDAAGNATVVWGEARANQTCLGVARFDPAGHARTAVTLRPCKTATGAALDASAVAAAANRGGDVAVAWSERLDAQSTRLLVRDIAPAGTLRPTAVVEANAGPDPHPSVALGGAQISVAWQQADAHRAGAWLRRFALVGTPLASKLELASYGADHPSIAASRNGQLGTIWAAFGSTDIEGQIFLPSGAKRPRGDLSPIVYDALLPGDHLYRPAIASDRTGGLVVVWESPRYDDDGTGIVGTVYNQLGDPQTPIFVANTEAAGAQQNAAVALADDGQFLVAWETPPSGADTVRHVHAALWREPHEDDACVYRGNTFLCELVGGQILAAPIVFGAGRAAGDVPLLGDVDGDGRADPCVRRSGQFLCNLSHDGVAVEWHDTFGAPGLPAMLGDLDGNGTADPCVRSGRTFVCDLGHDSGRAELTEVFGLASDVPVVGDVDGDGRADLCVFRAASRQFLCDTRHDGSRGLTYAIAALPGDRPLLGDVDGDGRVDFCVARGAKLLCDHHDGILAQRQIATRPSDWLLLGNVDGM